MSEELLHDLEQSIRRCEVAKARDLTLKAIGQGMDPLQLLARLTDSIRAVGEQFEKEAIWLPELIGAATALQESMPIVEEAIRAKGLKSRSIGSAVIGTVRGDIHSIGKAMVSTLLVAEGFTVHDLGVDVDAQKFIGAIRTCRPSVLAMSALLTTTCMEMKTVIEQLKKEGLRESIRIIIGGAPITEEFAASIGADGYSPTAPGGAKLASKLVAGVEKEGSRND
jgi:5-methyltetrahydrofolate--homocysteine methyltransferase